MAKRNCRRSKHEKRIHDKAVKLRKLPDEKLVEKFNDQFSLGYQAGYDYAKKSLDSKRVDERPSVPTITASSSFSERVQSLIGIGRKRER